MDSLTRRSLLIGGASVGVAALGGAALWYREAQRADALNAIPEYHGRSARLDEVADAEPADVCIVGSGPAGTSLGLLLAQAGLRTLIIEAGVNPSQSKQGTAYERLNVASHSGDLPYALTATRAMMPGGTSALWTGNTPRLLPIDFERNAYTPEGCSWPISYSSMDLHYEKAEDLLAVSGESNVRYMPPRSHPLSNERRGGNPAVKQLLKRADIVAFDTFRSRTPHGGPVRVARDLLPKFAAMPTAIFLPGVTVRRLVADSPGHIDGVLVRDPSGREALLRARTFVLAAGAVESARRLLLSKSEYFPDGLGNAHDQVGRTFSDHYDTDFTGSIAARALHLTGTLPQTVRSFQFYETFKKQGLGSVCLTVSLRATPDPRRVELRMTGDCELEPDASNRITLSESTVDAFGDPAAHLHFSATERDRRTQKEMAALVRGIYQRLGAEGPHQIGTRWGHHHLSTVRMGRNPRTSVVDAELQLHGVRNGYVLSSGNFVTSGPANPTLLIVAFAHRLASHIVLRMREGAYAEARKRSS